MTTTDLTSLSKSELLAHWFQRVWSEEDPTAIDQMLGSGAVIEGFGNTKAVGPEAFKIFQAGVLKVVKEMRFTLLRTVEDGDWIAGLWQVSAKRRDTGADVSATGTAFVEVKDGKMIGGYNHFDALGFYTDMGLLPTQTTESLAMGEPLKLS